MVGGVLLTKSKVFYGRSEVSYEIPPKVESYPGGERRAREVFGCDPRARDDWYCVSVTRCRTGCRVLDVCTGGGLDHQPLVLPGDPGEGGSTSCDLSRRGCDCPSPVYFMF